MKILFLDIDGVLNSHDWFKLRGERKTNPDESKWKVDRLIHDLDPRAVARLCIIIERTDAYCVLSSTWRLIRGLDETRNALVARGFPSHRLISATPDLAQCELGVKRGSEIQKWLESSEGSTCEKFVIVDDDSDMGPLLPNLVITSTDYGLTDSEMVRIIHRLR